MSNPDHAAGETDTPLEAPLQSEKELRLKRDALVNQARAELVPNFSPPSIGFQIRS